MVINMPMLTYLSMKEISPELTLALLVVLILCVIALFVVLYLNHKK